jgi:peptide/nickel transport system substrate-binding protein
MMKTAHMSRSLFLATAVAILSLLAACGAAPEPTAAPQPTSPPAAAAPTEAPAEPTEAPAPEPDKVTFIACVNNQPKNIDPHVGSSNPEQEVQTAGYETLVAYEAGGFDLKPFLATDWESNEDYTQLTLTIREGVKFNDGSDFNAGVAKAALERSMTIGQGESYFLDPVDTIEAPDPTTLVINLNSTAPEFVYGLTRIFINSQQAVEDHEVDGDLGQAWFAENVAGTGPYPMTEWIKGQSITFTRFDDYWQGWEGNHIDEYQLRVVAEPATQRLLVEEGECDYSDSITRDAVRELTTNPDLKVEHHTSVGPFYIAMNTRGGPLADVKMREALQYALDYETVIDEAMSGYATKGWTAVPEQFPQHLDTLPKPEFNLEKAKALIEEAGYNPEEVELTFQYLEPWIHEKTAGLILQSNLAEIGVKMILEPMPWATMVERHTNDDTRPDMSMYKVFSPAPTPNSILFPMYHSSSSHWSYFGYNNPQVDELLEKAPTIADDTERDQAYKDLQQLIWDDHPSIYPFVEDELQVFRANVQGYYTRPAWDKLLPYYDLYKE